MDPLDESPDVRQADTVEEMRAEIFRLTHANPLVAQVMRSADYLGLSGEDRYVRLAYALLRQNDQMRAALVEHVRLDLSAIIVPKAAGKNVPDG